MIDNQAAPADDAALEAERDVGPDDNGRQNEFTTDLRLEDLSRPPGLVAALVDWMDAASDRRGLRGLHLGAALCFVATLAGQHFESPTELRTNLYIIALAPSGLGKDLARRCIKRLAALAELLQFLGAGRIMSATALRNAVRAHPAILFMIDEVQSLMRQITERRGALHDRAIAFDLLELFSSAGTFFAGAEYARSAAVSIPNPNVSIYGTATPQAFWASLASQSAEDGLLARFVLFDVTVEIPPRVKPTATVRDVPPLLVAACVALVVAGGRSTTADGTIEPYVVPYSADAEDVKDRFQSFVDDRLRQADVRAAPFLNRAVEHAIKLALTVAVGASPAAPQITPAIMLWACRLAWLSTRRMIAETRDQIADTQREADFNKVLRLIRAAGPEGITLGRIVDRTRGIDARDRREILADLQTTGRVSFAQTPTGKRPKARYVANESDSP